MNAKYMSAIAIVGIGLVLGTQWRSSAENTSSDTENGTYNFGSGHLVISTQSQQTQVIKNASLKKIGNRFYVSGTGVLQKRYAEDDRYRWYDGTEVSYALDDVYYFASLTDEKLKDYENASNDDE